MTILLVTFSPKQGAISDNFRELTENLRASSRVVTLAPKGVVALSTQGDDIVFESEGLNPLQVLVDPSSREAFKRSRTVDPDVVFFYSTHLGNFVVARHHPTAFKVSWWHEPMRWGRLAVLRSLWNLSSDWLTQLVVDQLLFASSAFIDLLPHRFRSPHRHAVIRLPSLSGFFQGTKSSDPPPESDFLFFGNIEKYKGLHLVAEAISEMHAMGLRPRLSVFGKGNLELCAPRLLELSKVHPNSIRIYPGFHDYSVIREAIHTTKFVLMPYSSVTATNTVPIVWALGRPVIAPRLDYFAEIVRDDKTGMLYEPGSAHSLKQTMVRAMQMTDSEISDFRDSAYAESALYSGQEISKQIINAIRNGISTRAQS